MGFDATIKFRCELELKARVERLAAHARLSDSADWLRIAMEDYCNAEERRLKLPPITPNEIKEHTQPKRARRARPYKKRPQTVSE